MMPMLLSILLSLTHAEIAQTDAIVQFAATKLPNCVDDPKTIQRIKDIVKANRKSPRKYDGYRQALASDSDAELVARLAYAETLGANCASLNDEVAPRIVRTIANRIQLRGDAHSVVFQRDQFSSSLNIYEESRYEDFLCPRDANLWANVFASAKQELARKVDPQAVQTVNYFLYLHSPKWTKEPWKLEEDPSTPNEIRHCVRFFKVPGWK